LRASEAEASLAILPRADLDQDVSILITVVRGTGARRGAALERLDDDHAAAGARARVREWLGFCDLGAAGIAGLGLCRRHVEQAASPGDVVGARAAGKQTIVTDAVEARRQGRGSGICG
jgi:hypothetical protein